MLSPINDLCKVEITTSNKIMNLSKDTAENGILLELPDRMFYLGFWSFAFDSSLGNGEVLESIYEYWKGHIGKRVFWTALSEKGNILKEGDKEYAFVKLTSLIAIGDPDSNARNIHDEGRGAFNPV